MRRWLLALTLPLWLAACAGGLSPPAPGIEAPARSALAPTGTLRVGVYLGSPTSLVRNPSTGERAGIALDLGQALGRALGVPVQVMEYGRVALVLEAMKAGEVDFTFTNATGARAREVDFTPPMVELELGYLVPPDSPIANAAQVDRAGVRVGVSEGGTSQGVLTRLYRQATVVPAASMQQAQQMLAQHRIDAFATNKGILFELSDSLPGYRVLDGRWGLEHLAIAVPKGREAGMPALRTFARQVGDNGELQRAIRRAGLRGTASPDVKP